MNEYKIISKNEDFAFANTIKAKSEKEAKVLFDIELLKTYLKCMDIIVEHDIMFDPYDYINNYKVILEEKNLENEKI